MTGTTLLSAEPDEQLWDFGCNDANPPAALLLESPGSVSLGLCLLNNRSPFLAMRKIVAEATVRQLSRILIIVAGCFLISGSIKVSPSSAGYREGARYIRVMSFNIRYDEPRDKENAWPNRKELVASMIRFHQADLVGVQEALERQMRDLEKLLPDYGWVGVGRDDGKAGGEFSAIMYRKARFSRVESSTFWLSETPDVPGKGWDADYPRIVTWLKIKDTTTGKLFFHFNTHFDHRGVQAREESAKLLLKRISTIAGRLPVVVTGDFNFNESSIGYQILTGKILEKEIGSQSSLGDARYLSRHGHHGPTSTFNEFKALIPDMKIDYVLVKGNVRVLQHGALSDTWDGRFPSDHLPVLAEIAIE
ncbi:MAG TPA: endonuclease/exonuclease/phosphatase family protein [Pyrinomonadaceae bacterium]|nr:endonuclease/exonuclease/phosphatase family protein [Pyrinomonadaceae bacterium]